MTASSGGTPPGGYRLACWPSDPEAGVSIVELLVSLVILSLGAALSVGVLSSANRRIEQAELDLRAAIYLGELSATNTATWAAPDSARPAGPGRLILETGAGPIAVRYEPPASASGGSGFAQQGLGGFRTARSWRLSGGS